MQSELEGALAVLHRFTGNKEIAVVLRYKLEKLVR